MAPESLCASVSLIGVPECMRCQCLTEGEVVVVMVDYCGHATVGVDLRVVGAFMLARAEVEVLCLVGETELLKDKSSLPVGAIQ